MKYLVNNLNLIAKGNYFLFPKHGDKFQVKGNVYFIHELNNEGNDAGFGWVWLYNPVTSFYDYKMSIFDRRIIPGTTEIPDVGLTNEDAYLAISKTYVEKFGFELSLKNIWNILKNGLKSCLKFR